MFFKATYHMALECLVNTVVLQRSLKILKIIASYYYRITV